MCVFICAISQIHWLTLQGKEFLAQFSIPLNFDISLSCARECVFSRLHKEKDQRFMIIYVYFPFAYFTLLALSRSLSRSRSRCVRARWAIKRKCLQPIYENEEEKNPNTRNFAQYFCSQCNLYIVKWISPQRELVGWLLLLLLNCCSDGI